MESKIIKLLGGKNETSCRCIKMKDLDKDVRKENEIDKDDTFGIYSFKGEVYVIFDFRTSDTSLSNFDKEVQKYILEKLESGDFVIDPNF